MFKLYVNNKKYTTSTATTFYRMPITFFIFSLSLSGSGGKVLARSTISDFGVISDDLIGHKIDGAIDHFNNDKFLYKNRVNNFFICLLTLFYFSSFSHTHFQRSWPTLLTAVSLRTFISAMLTSNPFFLLKSQLCLLWF